MGLHLAMTTLLGFDLGTKSLGISIRNKIGMVSPLKAYFYPTLQLSSFKKYILALIEEHRPSLLVFGLPRNQNGTDSEQTKWVLHVLEGLKDLPIPIETVDEYLTTVEAVERLHALGMNEKKRKAYIDSVSACVILEQYIQHYE
jgi:putative holliday junction resolvase